MTTFTRGLQRNGIDIAAMRHRQAQPRRDASTTDRQPRLAARWVGGGRARVELGDLITDLGGEGERNAMQALLAALAACDVEIVALHASLLGIKVDQLSVQAEAWIDGTACPGLDEAPGPGLQSIRLIVQLRAPGASPEQIDRLRSRLEHGSPASDSLGRAVPVEVRLEAETQVAQY